MAGCCISDLRDKEVINVCDGKRLGYVMDVEIDICNGRLLAILVPGEVRCLGFGKSEEIRIPWENIERVGDDIILVNVNDLLYRCEDCKEENKKRKRFFF